MTLGNVTLVVFGPVHTTTMVAILVVAAALSTLLRRTWERSFGARLRRVTCGVLGLVLLLSGLAENVVLTLRGYGSWEESLPLHLCDIALIVCVLVLFGLAFRKSPQPLREHGNVLQTLYELAYFWALGGTTQAVLTPDIYESFPDPICVRYFLTHGGTLVAVAVMTIGCRMRPRPGSPLRVWLMTAALAPPVMLVNWLLDANYMFLCGPPERPSLYDYFGRWPWALLTLAAVGAVVFALCYLPFWIVDVRRRGASSGECDDRQR